MMTKPTDEIILETIREVRDHVSDIDKSLEKDGDRIGNLEIAVKAMEAQLEELRRTTNRSAEKVKDKVQSVVDPIVESTDRLNSTLKKSKKIYITEKLNWIQKLLKK